MPSFLLARLLLVFFSAVALGCSGKHEDPAPVTAPPAMTGTWELTKQVTTTFNANGTTSVATADTYVASGQIWRYVLTPDGRFDYTYQGQTARKGTYTNANGRFVQTNDPGYGNTPTVTYTIQQLGAAELVLVSTSRATTGVESVTTWARR